jgi:uncharacterized membrane protein YkvA (DUF1232 family)
MKKRHSPASIEFPELAFEVDIIHSVFVSLKSVSDWYSAPGLWRKLGKIAQKAGDKVVFTSLILFHCLQDKDTPAWARTAIVGALGYLILPADLVPDIIPGAGLADDWGALVAALGTISIYIKDVHKQKAREQADRLFSR